jgi:hypothetical protein
MKLPKFLDWRDKRLKVKDVLPGDYIYINHKRAEGVSNKVFCLSNDPEAEMIYLQIKWTNFEEHNKPEFEKFLLSYDDSALKDFHLLNSEWREHKSISEDDALKIIETSVTEALKSEDYEKVAKIKKTIDSIFK